MHPDVTVPLWTRALRNGSRRDWGNLLAMLKRALPRHTASNDLLKKHISTPFPIFHTSSLIYSPSFHPPDSFFFSSLTLFLLVVFSISFCSPKTSLSLALPSFRALLHPAQTNKCVQYNHTYPSLMVMLTITAIYLPNPYLKMNLVINLTFASEPSLKHKFFAPLRQKFCP